MRSKQNPKKVSEKFAHIRTVKKAPGNKRETRVPYDAWKIRERTRSSNIMWDRSVSCFEKLSGYDPTVSCHLQTPQSHLQARRRYNLKLLSI